MSILHLILFLQLIVSGTRKSLKRKTCKFIKMVQYIHKNVQSSIKNCACSTSLHDDQVERLLRMLNTNNPFYIQRPFIASILQYEMAWYKYTISSNQNFKNTFRVGLNVYAKSFCLVLPMMKNALMFGANFNQVCKVGKNEYFIDELVNEIQTQCTNIGNHSNGWDLAKILRYYNTIIRCYNELFTVMDCYIAFLNTNKDVLRDHILEYHAYLYLHVT